jgi:hypothetical protein
MKQCPTIAELHDFLEEERPGIAQEDVATHLEGCAVCRQRLDRLLIAEDWPGRSPVMAAAWRTESQDGCEQHHEPAPPRPTTGPASGFEARRDIVFPLPPTAEAPLGQLGSFDVLARLGEGTYAVVYQAHDRDLGRPVALKVLRPELAELAEVRKRFEQEARAAAAVESPHVVIIHHVYPGTTDFAQPFIVMEYFEGQPLSALLRPEGLEPRQAAGIAVRVARGLTAAHGRGVVHRDIKPANILVARTDEELRVKIADFGIAQGIEELRQAEAPAREGTRGYMSPEANLDPARVDFRSDLFSLGVTLYQMLTGRLPVDDKQPAGQSPASAGEAVPRPHAFKRRSLRDLEAITMRCLARASEQRYATAAELADHLDRWLNHEPVPVRRHGAWELLGLWCRRKPLAAGLLALVAAAVLAGVVVLFAWQRAEFRGERNARLHSADAAQEVDQQWHAADFREPGSFVKVRDHIRDRLDKLPDEDQYAQARQLLEAKLVLANHLADAHEEFLHQANDTWFMMGEERAAEARRACERALASFGVLQHDSWWMQSPAADLTDKQKGVLHREAYRLLLLRGAVYIQQGLQEYQKSVGMTQQKASQLALTILNKARAMESAGLLPASHTVALLEKGATKLATLPPELGKFYQLINNQKPPNAAFALPEKLDNDADCFFLGFMHRYLGAHQNDLVSKAVRYLGPDEFDYVNSLDTAESLLRRAAVKDPLDWWTWFVLGRVLQEKKDYSAAEVAFGNCISLRPTYSRGHEHRGLMLVHRALGSTKPVVRADLLKQAERDSQTAAQLAPHDFSTHWVRGDMDRLLDRDRAALDAYAHALVLIRRLQAVPSLSSRHKDIKEVVDRVLAQHPNDPDGLALKSLLNLAQAETAARIAEAAGAFAALEQLAPQHLLTQLGHAQALERLAAADAKNPKADWLRQALAEYAAVCAIAVGDPDDTWKHVEAWKGRARVLLRLAQPRQAEQAWQEARRFAPLLPRTLPAADDDV